MLPDNRLAIATDILTAAAGWREQSLQLAARLRDDPVVREVTSGLDVRAYTSGVVLELFIDAELTTGTAITFWIDVIPQAEERWRITSEVRGMRGTEQELLRPVQDADVVTFSQVDQIVTRSLEMFATLDPSIAL